IGQAARGGGGAEPREPDNEDPPAAQQIAERAADEQQRAQREQVCVDGPLQPRHAGMQLASERRKRDVDDGHVEERNAGSEHRRGEDAATLRAGQLHRNRRKPRGTKARPSSSKKAWATTASTAAGIAPSRTRPRPAKRMPVRIGCPYPPAPIS